MAKCSLDTDLGQGKASEVPGREGEARGQPLPCRTVRQGNECMAPEARGSVSSGHRKAGDEECGQEGEL